MSHDQTLIANAWNGWGASSWISSGWIYYLLPGESCVRMTTNAANSGTPPGSFDPEWFDLENYAGTITVPDPVGDPENQMVLSGSGWIWWGPRNRYYLKFKDGIGRGPTMICGTSPATQPMFAFDPDDSSTQLVLLPGATS